MARPKEFDETQALDAAQDLFWEKGYEASSLTLLTERMGIQRTSLYGTFGDKRQLFLTVLDRYRKNTIAGLDKALHSTSSPRAAIEVVLRYKISTLRSPDAEKGCFCVNEMVELAPHDAEVAAHLAEYNLRVEQMLFDTIERGREQGEMQNVTDSRAAARFLTNILVGLHVVSRMNPDVSFVKDTVEMTLKLLD